ncbi:Precorrin-2 C(20)-methyltransferase [Halomicronema hongdechloris C2206]|uniref:Precorrin-2 C(20)-methyltransferase n=1 Tax=Halomicronema hongdechloris C2206 TaxID=1641165 RepID=A0A1Z3HM49_9CYAN|nr:precorrin-2 C(20)-methyltransferase [Halomicronema hongdechloris]ASC71360.1 Precorrin-2 C(20)-methyltransferase [Halomicronema hongdechloris C2206]
MVAFPAGHDGLGVAQRTLMPWLRSEQQQLPLSFSFSQDRGQRQSAWQEAAAQVWGYLRRGDDVVFASEGDVSFYSTFTYLAQTLLTWHPQVSVEVVPGVCSPLATAAVLGIPLTIQSQRLAVLPALYRVAELERVLDWAEAVVLMKVSSVYPQVWSVLQQRGLLSCSYVVQHVTWPDQLIYTDLQHHPNLELSYFSVMIIQVAANSLG